MRIFDCFNKKNKINDDKIVSICTGEMIETSKIEDEVFSSETMGKTFAFIPDEDVIVSPCNGTVEMLFPTGHAFAIRSKTGTGIIVHIGINTVDLNGECFKIYVKQGMEVSAGQKIVKADFDEIKRKGYPITTMMIISEPEVGKEYEIIKKKNVIKGEILN